MKLSERLQRLMENRRKLQSMDNIYMELDACYQDALHLEQQMSKAMGHLERNCFDELVPKEKT